MRSDEDWLSTVMPRSRHRACPQGGLKLDLNRLARKGYIKFGANIGAKGIVWSNSLLERNRERHHHRRHDRSRPFLFRIAIGSFEQWITLVSRRRYFGGHQWFLLCPVTHRWRLFFGPASRQGVLQPAILGQASYLPIAIVGS